MISSAWISENKGYLRQILVCCSVSILPFGFGQFATWPSLAIEQLLEGDAGFSVDQSEISIIASTWSLGLCLLPILFGFMLVRQGRRRNLLITAVVYIVAWALILFARSPLWLMAGNFIGGLGSSIQLIIGPIFIAEIADKYIRGALISFYIAAIPLGQAFMCSVGIYVTYFQLNLIALVISTVAFFCILATAVESPSWKLMKQKESEAESCFNYYWNTRNADRTESTVALAELRETVELEMRSKCSYSELVRTPSNVRGTIIVAAISLFQSASGILVILDYGSTTLPKYEGFWAPHPTMAAVSILYFFLSLVSAGLVDRLGRKPLTILSNAGDALGTAIVAVFFALERRTEWDTTNLQWLPYVGMLLFIASYGSAMSAMPHVLVGELFPANVRYHASVLSVIAIAGSLAFFNYTYLGGCRLLGMDVMFFIYTLCSIAATIFSWLFMFETKNLSLAEIQAIMTGRKMASNDPPQELNDLR
nr:PREDICTED: sugar transporter ERD6-like 17 [Bemisia tabaci]